MKQRSTRLILFIALPFLIFARVILFFQVYFRSALFSSPFNQASGDSLDVNVEKQKFNVYSMTELIPEISFYPATNTLNEDSSAMPSNYVYEGGVTNLEFPENYICHKDIGPLSWPYKKLKIGLFHQTLINLVYIKV